MSVFIAVVFAVLGCTILVLIVETLVAYCLHSQSQQNEQPAFAWAPKPTRNLQRRSRRAA